MAEKFVGVAQSGRFLFTPRVGWQISGTVSSMHNAAHLAASMLMGRRPGRLSSMTYHSPTLSPSASMQGKGQSVRCPVLTLSLLSIQYRYSAR